MRSPEHQLQRACVRWFRYQYPNSIIFAIPNGGLRNKVTAAKLKAEGVLAGVPDLFIATPNSTHSGLFIEMKAGRGKPTELQIEMHERLYYSGYMVAVCNRFEQFQELVTKYMQQI